jgi:hypothetical protein
MMNSKLAKYVRKIVRVSHHIDPSQVEYEDSTTLRAVVVPGVGQTLVARVQRRLKPECGREIYHYLKKVFSA